MDDNNLQTLLQEIKTTQGETSQSSQRLEEAVSIVSDIGGMGPLCLEAESNRAQMERRHWRLEIRKLRSDLTAVTSQASMTS